MDPLNEFLRDKTRLVVLTGAGCSAASGIPTYRDHQGNWQHKRPIQHQEFVRLASSRQRYWARSYGGWPPVRDASPNTAHRALAALEARGQVALLVTQNVDRLHQKAGHRRVVDLHGRLDQVICLSCDRVVARNDLQQRLAELNPQLAAAKKGGSLAPDGDADVADELVARMRIPDCQFCGGILKPRVVFFGDSVDRGLVAQVFDELDGCDGMLVVGSSLMIYSGYRFCRYAAARSKPIACINVGRTRADDLLQLKLAKDCGEVLGDYLNLSEGPPV